MLTDQPAMCKASDEGLGDPSLVIIVVALLGLQWQDLNPVRTLPLPPSPGTVARFPERFREPRGQCWGAAPSEKGITVRVASCRVTDSSHKAGTGVRIPSFPPPGQWVHLDKERGLTSSLTC